MKFLFISVAILLLMLSAAGVYTNQLYQSAQDTVNTTMQEDLDRNGGSERRIHEVSLEDNDAASFLLLGTDGEGSHDRGRSDTIMVATMNPEEASLKMVNIPRDTRVEIPGRPGKDKINHAYAYGGSDLAMETTERFLDVPIDYVIRVNMDGFTSLVDAVGGVNVYNDFHFEQDHYEFHKGNIDLDGDQALAYTRMRKDDPQGDSGRNERQQQVVEGIIDEGASFQSVTRIEEIIDSLGDNIRTNLDFDMMNTLVFDYSHVREDIRSLSIEGSGRMIENIYYLDVPESERSRISDQLNDHLGL
ncbi:LCP family glycopolymer transferase [Salisediminibacterium beveridgei]|nr:LCP family protein [Salisediminibacterium beveridgei]